MRPDNQPATAEPTPEAPQDDSTKKAPTREPTGGARIAAVFAGWFAPNLRQVTPDEVALKQRFSYWSRQLARRFADPEGELLSELASSNRLDALVPPVTLAHANQILRSAFLDIIKRERGRGAAKDSIDYVGRFDALEPVQEPMQERRIQALQQLDHLTSQLGPLQEEALRLRQEGLTDEDAGKASMRPCNATTFRRRVHDAQCRARELAAESHHTKTECEDTEKETT